MKKGRKVVSLLLTLAMMAGLFPASAYVALAEDADNTFSIDNGYIKVEVSKENGGFSAGTLEGDKLKKSDNNKKLLYHDGKYDTSFISLRVKYEGDTEATDYLFGGRYGGAGDASRDGVSVNQAQNGDIFAVWSVGEGAKKLTFTQTISLENAASNQYGMISVSLEMKNNGTVKVTSAQARILLDTYLGSKDFGCYQVVDNASVTNTLRTEQVVDADNLTVPQNFFAVDHPSSPEIMAYTVNNQQCMPYQVAFGHWNNLAASLFDFGPDSSMDFTDPLNQYLTADSAYALYYNMGSDVAAGNAASLSTFYGVMANAEVAQEDRVAVNATAPNKLELNSAKTDYDPLVSLGETDFQIGVSMENYPSSGASDLGNIELAVFTTENLRPLTDAGAVDPNQDFGTSNPYRFSYSSMSVGQTINKTLNFQAKPCENAAYEKVTLEVYDVSTTGGALEAGHLLGQKEVYILLPGNDGNIPKVGFTSMTPTTVYSSGERHLFVAVTNAAMLDNRANWNLKAYPGGGGGAVSVPHSNLSINDGIMDVVLDDTMELAVGSWYLQLEWTNEAVGSGIVAAKYQKQTANALKFTVSADPKYKNDTYGVVAVVQYDRGNNSAYEIRSFSDEEEFKAFSEKKGDYASENYTEILLIFRGEFTMTHKFVDANGVVHPMRLTAVSTKTMDGDRKWTVDNGVTVNDCLDFEGGTMSVYYKNYDGGWDDAKRSSVRTEFDGQLLTSIARTSVWKGKAVFTELAQKAEYSLRVYNQKGERDPNFSDKGITLIWPSVGSAAQSLAGLFFNFAFGELGVMKEKTNFTGAEIGRVVGFSANMDLSFTGASDPGAPKKDSYWSRLQDIWKFHKRDVSLYEYAYNSGPIEQMLDWSTIDETPNSTDKTISASVMVRDILFGAGQGFVGMNFSTTVAVANYIDGLPKIVGSLQVNTINDWSFSFAGGVSLATFSMEAKLSFKSRDDVPVPDDIYFYIGGFKPGINIDGFGVVWITGGGGGISKLYDTIFLTQAVPPLKLIMSVGFSIVQVLDGKATLGVGLTGISLKGEDLKIFGTIDAVRMVQLGLEWYPGLDLRASISVYLFEGVIRGGGYIVLIGKNYQDWFFEMFVRAQLTIPDSIPLAGGMSIGGVDLGLNTEKIWGAIDIALLTLGITYYWGEKGVDFGIGTKAQPTYPSLLGYDDVPVYYDSEREQTLYAHVGTNIDETLSAGVVEDLDHGARLMAARGIWSNPERTSHKFNTGPAGTSDSIVQMSFDAESLAQAKQIASGFKVTDGEDGTRTVYPLVMYSESSDNAANCNANVSYDETTGKGSFAFTVTDPVNFGKDWYVSTGTTYATAVLYNVAALPELHTLSGANASAGGTMAVNWSGSLLAELDQVSFYLCETDSPEDAGIPLETLKTGLESGTASVEVPASVGAGSYYLKAVYMKEDSVNGVCFSSGKVTVSNSNTPGAVGNSLNATPAGDLKVGVTVPATSDVNTEGYLATVYDKDGIATDIAELSFDKAASGATVFEIGGSYQSSGGTYKDGSGDAAEAGGTFGLSAGKPYKVGVTPYKLLDTDSDGEKDTAVYGKEVMTNSVTLPTPKTPAFTVNADQTKQVQTKASADGSSIIGYDVYTSSDITFTGKSDSAVTGTWSLDGLTADGVSGTFSDSREAEAALTGLTEGEHVLTFKGRDAEGDGFRYDYGFTVDTLPPRLMLSSPTNGGYFSEGGTLSVAGVTDPDAKFSVLCDGTAVCTGKTIAQLGGTLANDGVFRFEVPMYDPHGSLYHSVTITAADEAGNQVSERAEVTHGGLGNLDRLELMVDGRLISSGNIPVRNVAGQRLQLDLVGVTKGDGNGANVQRFSLADLAGTRWICSPVKGNAYVDADGLFEPEAGSQGMVTGKLEITEGAYMTASMSFGALNSAGLVETSATLGGTVTGAGNYDAGELVTLKAVPSGGYTFSGWTVTGVTVSNLSAEIITFTMPANGTVTAEAKFTPTVSGKTGGTIPAERIISAKLPVGTDPDTYVPYYIGKDGKVYIPFSGVENGVLRYLNPGPVCLYENNAVTFRDTKGHWAEDSIEFSAAREMVKGVGEGIFEPDAPLTRGMLLTVLYRMEGSPAVSGKTTFGDVETGSWYEDAVLWGVKNGIAKGYDALKFGPNDKITREQMCTMLDRYLNWKGYSLDAENPATAFADNGKISSWASSSVQTAQVTGLVNGRPGNLFAPGDSATRAETTVILERMIKKLL